jgi:hypothetical protein
MRNPLLASLAVAYMLAVHLTIIKSMLRFDDAIPPAYTNTLSLQETASTDDNKDSFVARRYGPQFAINVNHERLKNISLQQGNWIGTTWIPPYGWRAFSAADLRTLYKERSMLWLGDSTSRRTAYLFHAIINSDVNASWINSTDPSVRDSRDPTLNDINADGIIDMDKHYIVPSCKRVPKEFWGQFEVHVCRHPYYKDDLPEAQRDSEYISRPLVARLLRHNITPEVLSNITAKDGDKFNNTQQKSTSSLSRLLEADLPSDYKERYFMLAYQGCWAHIVGPVKADLERDPELRLTSLVDTVIVSAGIWEAYYYSADYCDSAWFHISRKPNTTHNERLQTMFETLMDLQSPTLEVVFRTPGYATFNETMAPIDAIADYTRQYAAKVYSHSRYVKTEDGSLKCMYKGDAYTVAPVNDTNAAADGLLGTQCAPNLTFVDWSGAIRPRSFTERIIGDIPPHYGFEPRMTMIQMLTNNWLERRQAGM